MTVENIETGKEMYELIERLYPICRSITGNGVRQTLKIIQEIIPLEIKEVPSGTRVFDWEIPKEWNIKDAYIKNSKGEKIVDFKDSNLHVLNYSVPIRGRFNLSQLCEHIFTLPDYPDWIPYLTSYYKEKWGFCMEHNRLKQLKGDEEYEVLIDSSLEEGSLTYGEYYLPGNTDEEILFSTYVCHPSLCNDNLSGVALLTHLAAGLKEKNLKYSYRFLFIPETIGAITWLALNEDNVSKIKCGLVVTCVGDSGIPTYKRTRKVGSYLNDVVEKVLEDSCEPYNIVDFFPVGSDERQFSSPGFQMEIGSLMRTMYTKFEEYHTSADNLEFINANSLEDSLKRYQDIVHVLEGNEVFASTNPKCEPQLGKRGLYSLLGAKKEENYDKNSMFWILNFSDGEHSLLEISKRSGIAFKKLRKTADILQNHNLITPLRMIKNKSS